MCGCKKIPRKDLFLGKHLLQVDRDVDEPSNIKWENQDVSSFEFYCRKFIVVLAITALMCFSALFLLVANSLVVTRECADVEYTEDSLQTVLATKDNGVLVCFCLQMGASALNKDGIKQVCKEYLLDSYMPIVMTFLASFVIQIVNNLVNISLYRLGNFARYKTVA